MGAISYLKNNLPHNQVFSVYDWGGYLIWKFPEKKVFIDGRMPSWRWNDNPDSESPWAMKDYLEILEGHDINKYLERYQIGTVLWPVRNIKKTGIYSFLDKKVFGKNTTKFIDYLKDNGWKEIYRDSISVIYQRK